MMNLYLPPAITTPIYFYIGWNDLRKDDSVSDNVWDKLCFDMCRDDEFNRQYNDYVKEFSENTAAKEKLLFFINHELNQLVETLPTILRMNKDFMYIYTKHNEIPDIKFISEDFRKNHQIMANVVNTNHNLDYLNEEMRENEEFLLTIASEFSNFENHWKSNREFILKAIKEDFVIWNDIDESLKCDKDFILEAINVDCGVTLMDSLWDMYPEFMGTVVEQNEKALMCSFEDCHIDPDAVIHFNRICNINPNILLRAVQMTGQMTGPQVLDYVDCSFKSNEPFILELLKITSMYNFEYCMKIISYIDDSLKSNPEFLYKAIRIRSDIWSDILPNNLRKICDSYGKTRWRLG